LIRDRFGFAVSVLGISSNEYWHYSWHELGWLIEFHNNMNSPQEDDTILTDEKADLLLGELHDYQSGRR
jgi:hypothetical protein